MTEERMLQWFAYEHVPDRVQAVCIQFHQLAVSICNGIAAGPERTVALRKLLEAKDAAVRAIYCPGG